MNAASPRFASREFVCDKLLLCALFLMSFAIAASAQTQSVRISNDNLTNTDSVHKTEVEPHSFAWGNTIVAAFHVARRPGSIGWGSGDVGYSTSTDGGKTWKFGDLPGLTVNFRNGTYGAAADPSVAYDAKHGEWLISTLPLAGLSCCNLIGDVAVSRSTNGLQWGNPIIIDKTHLDDKNWSVCDNTTTSPFYGNCYTEWDQAFGNQKVLMSVSSDGGLTWSPGLPSSDGAVGLGGEPVVQPNGTVIVPFEGGGIDVFSSTNGGKSWGRSQLIASITSHADGGGIRNPNLPSASIDGAGNVYVVWSDCRFRTGCKENDIVMSTSANGTTWSAVTRIPIDPTTSTVDHFLPGIGVDPTTSGANAHITIVYYYYPNTSCTASTCQLDVGFTTSTDGGQTWTAGAKIAGPMKLAWLPVSDNGPMVADYIAVSYSNGNPFGVYAVAQANTGTTYSEAIATTKSPLPVDYDAPRFSSANDRPVPEAKSDHPMHFYSDDEGKREIPKSRWIK
ncbi:MAG TPA: sialidase family protein [Candidatus Solibacter sp.]|nr:sialidase family protein [Candidatus Solibacter sp.]